MITLKRLLDMWGYDTTDSEVKESIIDNEYLLRSDVPNKRFKVLKNLQRVFNSTDEVSFGICIDDFINNNKGEG